MSLPTPPIVQAVALGANGITRGSSVKILVDLSTSGPGMATIVAEALDERGIVVGRLAGQRRRRRARRPARSP